MKKLFVFLLFSLLILSGCTKVRYEKTDYLIGNYEVYSKMNQDDREFDCAVFREVVLYEDDQYEWFIVYRGCSDTGYYVKHESNYLSIPEAMEEKIISKDQIRESGIGTKRDKATQEIYDENKEALRELYPNQRITFIATINEYHFFHVEELGVCEMVVEFTYEGYPFRKNAGCYQDFRSLYLFPVKDGIIYDVKTLIEENKITTKDFYELVYTPVYQSHSTYQGAYDVNNVVDITDTIKEFDRDNVQYNDVVIIFKYNLEEQFFVILKGSEEELYQVQVTQEIYDITKIDYTTSYMIVKKEGLIFFE